MYEKIKALYDAEKVTDTGVQKAVDHGWLTQEQADTIMLATSN